MRKIFVKNQRETDRIAKILAACLAEADWRRRKEAIVIGLEGELGSGKTTFVKAFAKGLGIKRRLTSPTFVLMRKYKPRKKPEVSVRGKNLYHIDCYRIKSYKDILALDFKEIISNPQNTVLIEWAEKIKQILPKNRIWIKFKIITDNKRKITIS